MATLVALAGFMGSGKTSVGEITAQLLGWPFVDLDGEIVERTGMAIAAFFARHGEPEFRRREAEVLGEVLTRADRGERPGGSAPAAGERAAEGLVLALGGGTLENVGATQRLARRGGVVFLEIDAERAWKRARGETRPLAQDPEAFAALLAARRPTYERHADWIVPVGDRSAEQIGREVAGMVRAAGPAWAATWGQQLIATARPSTVIGGQGSLPSLRVLASEATERGARLFVVSDENVDKAWGDALQGFLGRAREPLRSLVMPAGEQSKTARGLERCWDWLISQGARRDDVVVALGGGVVGDLAGFAAATYQRGVGLWQIPTSLLAQVDSSIGGKTAINLEAAKNLVGAFYQPGIVVIDPNTLLTLPQGEFTSGLGEVVKYGLLKDEGFFGWLEARHRLLRERDPGVMSDVVRACVRYKAAVVEEDERDIGRRAVLNLGHTAAHALEASLGFGEIRHGEAVALGLLVALAASERLLSLDPDVRRRTTELLATVGLPTRMHLPASESILAAAARDKKASAVSSGFVGLRSWGEPVWGLDLSSDLFCEALEVIRA